MPEPPVAAYSVQAGRHEHMRKRRRLAGRAGGRAGRGRKGGSGVRLLSPPRTRPSRASHLPVLTPCRQVSCQDASRVIALHCEALQASPDALRCESIPVAARTHTAARYGIAGHRLLVDLARRISRWRRPPDGPAARAKRSPGTRARRSAPAARWPCRPREAIARHTRPPIGAGRPMALPPSEKAARHTRPPIGAGSRVYMATKTVGW